MDEQDIIDRINAMTSTTGSEEPLRPSTAGGGDYVGSAIAQASALLNGYLSRRIDIDLQGRALAMKGTATLAGDQRPINLSTSGSANQRQVSVGLNVSALLPYALIGLVVYLAVRR